MRTLVTLTSLVLLVACDPIGAASPAPCLHLNWEPSTTLKGRPTSVDLLVVIDDSSLARLDEARAAIARLVRAVAIGDRNADGLPDGAPTPLRVAVITTHLGSAGHDVPGCETGRWGALGDDAVPHVGAPSCGGREGAISFAPGDDVDAFVAAVECTTRVGATGCGWEQPLEAALKALSPREPTRTTAPQYRPPTFRAGSGHGFGADGEGDDSVLAVVVVTDEDDCSVRNASLFDPSAYGGEPLETRCRDHQDALHDIARYVRGEDGASGLVSLRPSPRHVLVAAVVGVPPDVLGAAPDYAAILADHRMQLAADDALPGRARPSCAGPAITAFPPRRIVRTLEGLHASGARTFLASMCAPRLDHTLDALGAALVLETSGRPLCLSRPAETCVVHERLPIGRACHELPGRVLVELEVDTEVDTDDIEHEREICRLARTALGSGEPGYAVSSELCGEGESAIVLEAIAPLPGAEYQVICAASSGLDGGACAG